MRRILGYLLVMGLFLLPTAVGSSALAEASGPSSAPPAEGGPWSWQAQGWQRLMDDPPYWNENCECVQNEHLVDYWVSSDPSGTTTGQQAITKVGQTRTIPVDPVNCQGSHGTTSGVEGGV